MPQRLGDADQGHSQMALKMVQEATQQALKYSMQMTRLNLAAMPQQTRYRQTPSMMTVQAVAPHISGSCAGMHGMQQHPIASSKAKF